MRKKKIAIIGGGITGLSSAFYLQKKIEQYDLKMDIVLYESSDRLGGKIKTAYKDGNTMELGPDSLIVTKRSAMELVRDVGLENDIVYNNHGKTYILHRRKLHPVPAGAVMGIPTKLMPFVRTPSISIFGKARAAGDILLPRVINDKDISLGTFFRKRFGNEVVDYLIDPLLSGIYSGKIDELSLQATFPQFAHLEKKYRSLIIGMKKSRGTRQKENRNKDEQKGRKMFFSLKNGLSSLVETIADTLLPETVVKNAALIRCYRRDGKYHLQFANGRTDEVDMLIFATPHYVTRKLLHDYSFLDYLNEMPTYSKATVVLAYSEDAIKKDIPGSGFIVASKRDYLLSACTWTHKKWPHAAREGYALLRGYVGGAYDTKSIDWSDEEIVTGVVNELKELMAIEGNPKFYFVERWRNSFPQYMVGHKEKMNKIYKKMVEQLPGVFLAGASYEGVGVPDCIQSAKNAVEKVISFAMNASNE